VVRFSRPDPPHATGRSTTAYGMPRRHTNWSRGTMGTPDGAGSAAGPVELDVTGSVPALSPLAVAGAG